MAFGPVNVLTSVVLEDEFQTMTHSTCVTKSDGCAHPRTAAGCKHETPKEALEAFFRTLTHLAVSNSWPTHVSDRESSACVWVLEATEAAAMKAT